jgi:hypothetical protein
MTQDFSNEMVLGSCLVPLLEAHQHDVLYFGVVNLIDESKVIGTIDVWRCRSCNELFCEDKRFGATDLAPEVGFPRVGAGSKWGALICKRDSGSNWTLTAVKPGATLVHSCTPETKLELTVGPDYSLESGPVAGIGKHRIILVEQFVNAPVDVATGLKHTGTTDAYQALGKPFSFTPPLSATVAQSSWASLQNLAMVVFATSGLFLGFSSLLGTYELGVRLTVGLVGLASFAGAYSVYRKITLGSLGFTLVAILGLASYTVLRVQASGLGVYDYALLTLLVVDVLLGWRVWARIRSVKNAQWHPMDMPAYG